MAKLNSIFVEDSISKQRLVLSKLQLRIKEIDKRKSDLHKIDGACSPETNKLHKQISNLKAKERFLEAILKASESWLKLIKKYERKHND